MIDLSAVVSGPFGTSILADQGADVIMIEQAHNPDIIRRSGPLADSAQGVSPFFASQNRNKRSIALNLKAEAGKDLLKSLVATADVVVQNFRAGALERLGLGWETLRQVKPDLIMCSVSGFGIDGPYPHRPAFDPIVQSVSGYPMVQIDRPPVGSAASARRHCSPNALDPATARAHLRPAHRRGPRRVTGAGRRQPRRAAR